MSRMDIFLVIIIVGSCLRLIEDMSDFMVDNEVILRFRGFNIIWTLPMNILNIVGIYTMVATENNIDYRMKGLVIGILVSGILISEYYEKTITYKGIIINSKLYKWKEINSYSYDEDDSRNILFKTKKNDEVKLKLNKSNIKGVERLLNKKVKNKEMSNQI